MIELNSIRPYMITICNWMTIIFYDLLDFFYSTKKRETNVLPNSKKIQDEKFLARLQNERNTLTTFEETFKWVDWPKCFSEVIVASFTEFIKPNDQLIPVLFEICL